MLDQTYLDLMFEPRVCFKAEDIPAEREQWFTSLEPVRIPQSVAYGIFKLIGMPALPEYTLDGMQAAVMALRVRHFIDTAPSEFSAPEQFAKLSEDQKKELELAKKYMTLIWRIAHEAGDAPCTLTWTTT